MNTHIVTILNSVAKIAETPWTKRKSSALKKLVDELINVADTLAPIPDQTEHLEDFNQHLSELSTAIEDVEDIYIELEMADSPQETTAAVQQLDDHLSLTVELLTKLGPISQTIETSAEELRAKWLPEVQRVANLPEEQRANYNAALLLAPHTAREASVIRDIIRDQITNTIGGKS